VSVATLSTPLAEGFVVPTEISRIIVPLVLLTAFTRLLSALIKGAVGSTGVAGFPVPASKTGVSRESLVWSNVMRRATMLTVFAPVLMVGVSVKLAPLATVGEELLKYRALSAAARAVPGFITTPEKSIATIVGNANKYLTVNFAIIFRVGEFLSILLYIKLFPIFIAR
jgi:hypothetical protein